MASFKFIHAADLHLDSPLTGLANVSPEIARRINDASRTALSRLVQLAIDEKCRFLLISGDLFDGQWKDYRSGLFFAAQMSRLRAAEVPVYIILGNHDAENRFVSRLPLADNVTLFSKHSAETVQIEQLSVAIHGQSFARRDITENLAASYPPPIPGKLNIGLLHTSLDGREGHDNYAPCTVEQLKRHGYDYWALGHIHAFSHESDPGEPPYIVYSGVLQGRHIREAGPKGAVLVTVENDVIVLVSHRPLDSIRWLRIDIDVSELRDKESIVIHAAGQLERLLQHAENCALAVRVTVVGETALHYALARDHSDLREEIETAAAAISPELLIEKLELRTSPVADKEIARTNDPSIVGSILSHLFLNSTDEILKDRMTRALSEITNLPSQVLEQDREELLAESVAAARATAISLLESGMELGN